MARAPLTQSHILNLLKSHHVLTAPQIVDYLKKQDNGVNKTTVYRALEKMLSEGVLCRQTLSEETPVYELRDHHHDHLVCESCGKVASINCVTPPARTIEGFTISHHHLTMYGICSQCAHKKG